RRARSVSARDLARFDAVRGALRNYARPFACTDAEGCNRWRLKNREPKKSFRCERRGGGQRRPPPYCQTTFRNASAGTIRTAPITGTIPLATAIDIATI